MTNHTVVLGDSRRMKEVSDGSVHLVVTSPPYWQLKDYGGSGQIGYDDSYSQYINNLNLVWYECYRVLHGGCKLCVNIGDQFARAVYYGGYRVMPIRTEIIKFCESAGFDYMGAVIWQKATSMNTTGGGSVMGSYPFPRNGIVKIDYEFILLFKKPGTGPKVSKEIKEKSRLTKKEWNEYFSGHWKFSGARQNGHLAMFPAELPRRLIKMFTFAGETVLDPFLGSGTTTAAAVELTRNSVGYEINEEFLSEIKKKTGWDQAGAGSEIKFELERREDPIPQSELKGMIEALPYVYRPVRDTVRELDPKAHSYGQKIDGSIVHDREEYRSIKRIISPELLVLDNDEHIRLIGVKSKNKNIHKAESFLKDLIKGTKVYLKHEESRRFDENENLLAYLYLKNRTFVNAHLIKSGFVDVDRSWEYRNKDKFINLNKDQKK